MDELNDRPDELAAVRDLLSMPGPASEVVDSGRARLLAALAAPPQDPQRAPQAPQHAPQDPQRVPVRAARRERSRRGRSRWWAPVRNGLIGAASAAALALAVAVPSNSLIDLSPDPAVSASAPPTARQILLAAAVAMATAPSDGAYWRTRVVTGQLILSPDRQYVIKRQSVRETWLTRKDGQRDRWTGRYLGARPATPQDEAAWRTAGSPGRWQYPADVTGLGRVSPEALVESAPGPPQGGPHRVGWRNANGILTKQLVSWMALSTIPSDPTALRAFLVTHIARENGAYVGRKMEAELRESCLEIITGLPVSPEVRASAYQILASMPGMRPEGEVTDPLGRAGQALSYQVMRDGRLSDERLVIDAESGLPLATETRSVSRVADGRDVEIGSFIAYQQIGWTDEGPAR
ncbi:CU044_5270 family protein [Nonomuraea sp. NPDC049141]|uniref:CU044_5270 family protein n=1 Tax=Nonomuraea sp. NPDC049141 TaxID=3155500 RepID=UPI0033CF125E